MKKITDLNPKDIWYWFSEISKIPRRTFHEKEIMEFIVNFAKERSLEVNQDESLNVLIRKKAQNSQSKDIVCIQAHSDMVCVADKDNRDFDFSTQGIELVVTGEWLKANKTSLGADNGIGLSYILAILDDKEISHPPLEALITVSEEQGLLGANNLGFKLHSKYLINLDSEEFDTITIGSAGGSEIDLEAKYDQINITQNDSLTALKLSIFDLTSGHSGVEIHTKRANANKLLARFLYELNQKYDISISEIDGSGVRNVISMQSEAIFIVNSKDLKDINEYVSNLGKSIKKEYNLTEPNMKIELSNTVFPSKCFEKDFQNNLLTAYYISINGVYKINQHDDGVQTSCNLGSIVVKQGQGHVINLARSSSTSSLDDITQQYIATFAIAGFKMTKNNRYGSWDPKPNSLLTNKAVEAFKVLFNYNPKIISIHAGLEVSVIDKEDNMEKISIGPTMKEVHSPREKVHIESVEKSLKFLQEILKSL